MIIENWFSIIWFEYNVFYIMLFGINKKIVVNILTKIIYITEFSVDIKHVIQFEKLSCSAWATICQIDIVFYYGSE